jgi:hypothetical protein
MLLANVWLGLPGFASDHTRRDTHRATGRASFRLGAGLNLVRPSNGLGRLFHLTLQ